jgi:hypothetical protein
MQTDHPDFVYLPFAAGGRVYNPESRQAYAIEPGSCSCKQYKISGQTCKHLLELYRRLVAGEATWPLQDPAYLPEAGTEAARTAQDARTAQTWHGIHDGSGTPPPSIARLDAAADFSD